MPFSLTFVANGANDPQVMPLLQDSATGAAYDLTGVTPILRIGLTRPNTDPVTLLDIDGEHTVVTVDGETWNDIQFDPDPDDLLDLQGGTYPADLLTRETMGDGEDVVDHFDTGTVTIVRGASE